MGTAVGAYALVSGGAVAVGSDAKPRSSGVDQVVSVGKMPPWMAQCLSAEDVVISAADVTGTAKHPATEALAAARQANTRFAAAPATAFLGRLARANPDIGQDLFTRNLEHGPIWVVGFTGFDDVNPGGVPGSRVEPPRIRSYVVFYDDTDSTVTMVAGCYQGPAATG